MLSLANEFIEKISKQLFLFGGDQQGNLLYINQTEFIGVYYTFLYDVIAKLIITIGLDKVKNNLLLDLVIVRMMELASKLRSIELIEEYFGIKHLRQNYYNAAPGCLSLKSKAEAMHLPLPGNIMLSVSSYCFMNGFSKENKSQQPQILVALMVTKEGFSIAYEVFAGNTFEGPYNYSVVKSFIDKNKVKNFTVVGDAAMISTENIQALTNGKQHQLHCGGEIRQFV